MSIPPEDMQDPGSSPFTRQDHDNLTTNTDAEQEREDERHDQDEGTPTEPPAR